jgi:hypothetical protein
MSWPSAEDVQYWSGIFTVAGVLIAIGALFFAGKQLSLSQRAGSVTALAALHDSLRERWTDYLSEGRGKEISGLRRSMQLNRNFLRRVDW